jgi:hypothetical protein
MTIHKFLTLVGIGMFVAVAPGVASGQTTGSQTFTVVVPQSISIVAPAAATLTHDQTDNPQVFPLQTWVVKGNLAGGVNVKFTTAQPFIHTTDPSSKRDVKLDLVVGTKQGAANWTVTVPSDMSNHMASDPTAEVAASSNGIGRANLNLAVSFIGGEFGLFAAGDYVTTVVGTVAAN